MPCKFIIISIIIITIIIIIILLLIKLCSILFCVQFNFKKKLLTIFIRRRIERYWKFLSIQSLAQTFAVVDPGRVKLSKNQQQWLLV